MTKDSFRKYCLTKLRKSSKKSKLKKNKTICFKIIELINIHKPKNILLYIPLGMEVDLRSVIEKLRKKGTNVYVPYMTGETFVSVKYRLPLKKGRFGINEPAFSKYRNNKINLDMIVVPIVGVDATYRRVGFGAGMYDRFFSKLKNKPITVFYSIGIM